MTHPPTSAVVADALPLVRAGVRTVLEARGVTVAAETHSARDLASLVDHEAPGLVVIGSLADHGELDVVARIAEPHPAPLVVVLLTTANESNLAALLAAGADGVTRRSGTTTELDDLVARVLDGDRVVAPSLTTSLPGAFTEIDLAAAEGNGHDNGEPSDLSAREREMLVFLAQGRTNKEIADELSLSLATVKSHLVRVYAKLDVNSRAAALAEAVSRGLLG